MIPRSRNEGWIAKQGRIEHQYKVVLVELVTALGIGVWRGVQCPIPQDHLSC